MSVSVRSRSPRFARPSLRVVLALLGAAGGLAACGVNADSATTQVVNASAGCSGERVVGGGASLDLSGSGAGQGQAYLTGLEMGIAKVNSGGGVPGHNSCLELLYKNNRGSAAVDSQSMTNLVYAEGALAVVGSYTAASTDGASAYLHALGVPVTSFSSLAATFNPKLYPDTFPLTSSLVVQSQLMAKFAAKNDLTTVGLIVARDASSRGGVSGFTATAANDGVSIVCRASVSASVAS